MKDSRKSIPPLGGLGTTFVPVPDLNPEMTDMIDGGGFVAVGQGIEYPTFWSGLSEADSRISNMTPEQIQEFRDMITFQSENPPVISKTIKDMWPLW